MISPWSTNPDTTADRPYVFRGCFLDPFQGPVLANFITDEFKFTKAAVLYDVASDYPKGLAEFFKKSWEEKHGEGSVVAYESFTTKDADFSSQLTKIIRSGAEVLFTPQYYNEVALIVQQAKDLAGKVLLWGATAGVPPRPLNSAVRPVTANSSVPIMQLPVQKVRPRILLIATRPSTVMCLMT
ncbi:substrate-binding protein [Candidatus Electrothrix aarhusensis]|uniref:Substrate-binding protein n=1 Tax=Candidatus Electrothrix aarhusensis TaxID=1859131 RepID=A0A444J119_9BACT|nr:substrate-binding protein [Candidatus Electrothrix aarhusensis]